MAAVENKAVITSFVEEVINQGRLERADDLVAVDFVELDPLPGQQQGREGLKQVISAFRTAFPDIHWQKIRTNNHWSGSCERSDGGHGLLAHSRMASPASTLPLRDCVTSLARAWSAKRYMNMRPLYQMQFSQTGAVA